MPDRQVPRRRFLASGVAAAAGLAGCAVPGQMETERSSRTVDPSGETELVVENVNGDVTVTDGADVVEVAVTKRTQYGADLFEDVTVDVRLSGGRVRVETTQGELPVGASVSVDLEITLPDGVDVEAVRTRNGAVRAEDVPGDATLQTNNGEAVADGVDGYVSVRSTNGDVSVAGLDVAVETDRETFFRGTLGEGGDRLLAETTNGDVRLRAL